MLYFTVQSFIIVTIKNVIYKIRNILAGWHMESLG